MIDRTAAGTSHELSGDACCDEVSQRGDRIRHMPLHSSRGREGRNLRAGQTLVVERRFFTALRETLMKQESVSSDTQRRMVVKATPVAPFVLPQARFLLEFPIVALDASAHLGHEHQTIQRCLDRQDTQEVFERFSYGKSI